MRTLSHNEGGDGHAVRFLLPSSTLVIAKSKMGNDYSDSTAALRCFTLTAHSYTACLVFVYFANSLGEVFEHLSIIRQTDLPSETLGPRCLDSAAMNHPPTAHIDRVIFLHEYRSIMVLSRPACEGWVMLRGRDGT